MTQQLALPESEQVRVLTEQALNNSIQNVATTIFSQRMLTTDFTECDLDERVAEAAKLCFAMARAFVAAAVDEGLQNEQTARTLTRSLLAWQTAQDQLRIRP